MQNEKLNNAKSSVIKSINSLRMAWEDNPVAVMTAAGLLFAGTGKVLNSIASFRNSRSWDKEVKRRQEKDRNRRSSRI